MLWPLAFELGVAGTPIGVWVHPEGQVLVVDPHGELLCLSETTNVPWGVRWSLARHLRVHLKLWELVEAMQAGRVVGWLPDRIVEYTRRGAFPVRPARWCCPLKGELWHEDVHEAMDEASAKPGSDVSSH